MNARLNMREATDAMSAGLDLTGQIYEDKDGVGHVMQNNAHVQSILGAYFQRKIAVNAAFDADVTLINADQEPTNIAALAQG